jgi:hypothetical protein
MHGTNWLMLTGTKMVACLKPGTEVEISRIPFILRWTCAVKPGARALVTLAKSAAFRKRDGFILGNGQVVGLNELPHRLKMRVIALPMPERHREESLDLEARAGEPKEDRVAV